MAHSAIRPLILIIAVLLATSVPAMTPLAGALGGSTGCPSGAGSSANIGGVTAGGVTFQSIAGSQTIEIPRAFFALAVSTTGNLDVDIDFDCIKEYTFKWFKTDMLGQVVSNTVTVTHPCTKGTDTHSIPVGNDVVHIEMHLSWIGCDGTAGSDHRDVTVVDPALNI